ncbi:MAG: leucine-rich repeat domain-containing protein [Clostridia bacterium]|nr:leucine-rich repeat domain-containing protein [Clostridia bacterium]
MKRKLLLIAIMVVSLVCVLSFSVSAASTNEFGTVETSDTIDLTDMSTDETARVVLYDGTEYHTYPARYIVKSSTSFSLDFTRVNTAFTKEYGKNSIIRIEIPLNVIKITAQLNGGKNENYGQALVEVVFPENTAVTTFEWGCFEACSKLESIVIPGTLTTYNGQNHFASCTSLKEVTFGEGYNISYIPLNFFQKCTSLETIVFPNCVTEIKGGAFASCSKLKTIVFGANLQTMAGSMSDCATSGSVWYLPETFYGSSVTSEPPSNMFHWEGAKTNGVSGTNNNPKNITFVYTGTKEQALALQARFKAADEATGENCVGLNRIYDAIVCTEAEYEELTGKKVGEIATGYYIVYGYNKCKAFYNDQHAPSDEIKKTFVGQAFMSEYKVYTECSRECGEENVIETLDKLIHARGYSNSEIPGSKAMMHSFVVDKDLVDDYKVHFENLKLGVLAVGENASSPFNGNLIDTQGNKAHEKIAMVDYTEKSYDEIAIKIGGIDGYEDTALYFCGFVIGGESVYYIENETVSTSASTITYTQVSAILNPKE